MEFRPFLGCGSQELSYDFDYLSRTFLLLKKKTMFLSCYKETALPFLSSISAIIIANSNSIF